MYKKHSVGMRQKRKGWSLCRLRGIVLTTEEKRRVMAEVLRLSVEIMYSTHIYSFGGKCYKQREGGPIGLRSTCALARVVMAKWDIKWKARMTDSNVKLEDDGRFVDDARAQSGLGGDGRVEVCGT